MHTEESKAGGGMEDESWQCVIRIFESGNLSNLSSQPAHSQDLE